ncbi:hypothetical protein Tco_1405656 [Tanacetum coccineum]
MRFGVTAFWCHCVLVSLRFGVTAAAAAQPYSDNYYQAPKPQRSNATSSSTRPSASTRHKGKEIAKLVTPKSESVSEEDSDPEQAQRDKDMQKNLALLLYKPTNNNLRTSSNSRNKTEDTTPSYIEAMVDRNQMSRISRSEQVNDAHVDDADIRPIYNEEPMAEVQTSAEINIFAIGQQHIEQPVFNNEGEVDQNAEQCHDIRPLPAKLTDNMTTEHSDQSLESKNDIVQSYREGPQSLVEKKKDISEKGLHRNFDLFF